MSQEMNSLQETAQLPVKGEQKAAKPAQPPIQELLDSLRSLEDDIGQICELTSEEKLLVTEFFESLMKVMQQLATSVPVSIEVLSGEMEDVVQANMDPVGHLVVLYRGGQVELKSLTEEKHRDLMINVIKDILPKLKQLVSANKRKIENRIKILSSITKEMQKICKAFSTATTSGSQQ